MGYAAPATTNYGNLSAGIGQDVLSKMQTTSMWDPSGGNGSNGSWGYEGGAPVYNSDPNGNSLGTTNQPRYLVYHPGGQGPGEQYPYFDPTTGEFKGYRTGGGVQSYLSGVLGVAGAGLGFGMVGGAAGLGGGAGMAGDTTAAGYGGLSASDAATMGGGATVNGGMSLGDVAAGGTAAGVAGGAGGGAGLGSTLSGTGGQLATRVGLAGLTSALGGGGGAGSSGGLGGALGNLNLADLANLAGGAYGAGQQGDAANKMLNWMNGQQSKIDNLYAPNSPEFNYLWNQMSASDAAAGRNSQYGPRAVDMAGKIAQIKADATSRITGALAPAYQKALNQDASKYAGITAPLGSLLSRAGGGLTLGNLLQSLGLGGSAGGTASSGPFYGTGDPAWQDAVNSGQVQMPDNSVTSDPNEEDVLSFINRWGTL